MAQLGYKRIKIKVSQQVIDVPIPVANARVEGGTAEWVEEELVEKKSSSTKVETAALTPEVERAAKQKPTNRASVPARQPAA